MATNKESTPVEAGQVRRLEVGPDQWVTRDKVKAYPQEVLVGPAQGTTHVVWTRSRSGEEWVPFRSVEASHISTRWPVLVSEGNPLPEEKP